MTSVAPPEAGTPRHLHAVDVVRLLTVVGVIAVHVTAFTTTENDVTGGAALTLLHVTREVFLFLSAFVLTYSYRNRALRLSSFWRRRYPLVLLPYATWTALYIVIERQVTAPFATLSLFARDLLTGGAMYHLYFLAVTMQLYLVFPFMLRALVWLRERHAAVLGAAVTMQLAIAGALHYGAPLPSYVHGWAANPSPWLVSYPLFVLAGAIAALHFDEVTAWLQTRTRFVLTVAAGVAAAGLASYAFDIRVLGMHPDQASEVFQPAIAFESIAFVLAMYAFGIWFAKRSSARVHSALESSSDVSFGVYLAHPALLTVAFSIAATVGLRDAVARLPVGIQLPALLAIFVPAVYFASAAGVSLVRRTPLSLALSGRRQKRQPVSQTVDVPVAVVPPLLEEPLPAGATS